MVKKTRSAQNKSILTKGIAIKNIDPPHTEIPEVMELLSKRNRTLLIGSFVIVIIVMGSIYPKIIQNNRSIFAVIVLIWFASLIISIFSWAFSKCPRCGRIFFPK
jgi:uncharacterized membrane protein